MRLWVMSALALAACGTDPIDLTGMYQVESDVGSAPCGTDMAVPMAPPYIKFLKQKFFGVDILTYQGCNDAAGTDCMDSGGGLYEIAISNGWKGEETFDSSSGTSCTLGYVDDLATISGKQLTVEHSEYSDTFDTSAMPVMCTTDEAKKRGTSMTCEMHTHIEAMRL
jgi:hypothetical protein